MRCMPPTHHHNGHAAGGEGGGGGAAGQRHASARDLSLGKAKAVGSRRHQTGRRSAARVGHKTCGLAGGRRVGMLGSVDAGGAGGAGAAPLLPLHSRLQRPHSWRCAVRLHACICICVPACNPRPRACTSSRPFRGDPPSDIRTLATARARREDGDVRVVTTVLAVDVQLRCPGN